MLTFAFSPHHPSRHVVNNSRNKRFKHGAALYALLKFHLNNSNAFGSELRKLKDAMDGLEVECEHCAEKTTDPFKCPVCQKNVCDDHTVHMYVKHANAKHATHASVEHMPSARFGTWRCEMCGS